MYSYAERCIRILRIKHKFIRIAYLYSKCTDCRIIYYILKPTCIIQYPRCAITTFTITDGFYGNIIHYPWIKTCQVMILHSSGVWFEDFRIVIYLSNRNSVWILGTTTVCIPGKIQVFCSSLCDNDWGRWKRL